MDGLARLTDFLGSLKSKKIHYRLDHFSDEGITVTLSLPGQRVGVEFFPITSNSSRLPPTPAFTRARQI